MGVDRVIEVLLALLTVAVGWGSFFLATRATREQGRAGQRAVDAAAYDRAREIYDSALNTLREELGACRAELNACRAEITQLRNELLTARNNMAAARREITQLQFSLDQQQPRDDR